ncbi:hypothetical protein [Streptomyces sp. NPDC056387]|uniref:hypothetical protein n=1 Tax=Streptomyces sp. NPDC056387 TaxID=3345803 RepID=UPI0035E0B242
MTVQPPLRDQALDAAAQALNAGRYWLPAEAQAAVVDAVAATFEADRNRVLDNLLAEADRIDATTYKTCEGGIAMSGMAAGIREAVRTFRSRSEEHHASGARLEETGTEVTHPTECGDACIEHHTYGPDCAALNPDWEPTAGLRERYAAALYQAGEKRAFAPYLDSEQAGELADAILAVRDVELTNSRRIWREQHADLIELYQTTRARAEKAETTVAAVRAELDAIERDAARLDASESSFRDAYADAATRIRTALEPPKEQS